MPKRKNESPLYAFGEGKSFPHQRNSSPLEQGFLSSLKEGWEAGKEAGKESNIFFKESLKEGWEAGKESLKATKYAFTKKKTDLPISDAEKKKAYIQARMKGG